MREIKFRAWDKRKRFNFSYTWEEYKHDICDFISEPSDWVVIEQYTGLKDKNGVEFYEGDIVSIYNGRGVVVFFEGSFCCYNGYFTSPFGASADSIEIIGNIHENPELLEA